MYGSYKKKSSAMKKAFIAGLKAGKKSSNKFYSKFGRKKKWY